MLVIKVYDKDGILDIYSVEEFTVDEKRGEVNFVLYASKHEISLQVGAGKEISNLYVENMMGKTVFSIRTRNNGG